LAIWLSDWIITHPDNSQARLTLRVLSPVFAGKEATEYVGLSGWSALHICWNESQRILQELQRLLTEGGRYWGRIASREKGGFLVELREPDITAFLPKSQADVRKPTDWNSYIGVECNFEIIGVDEWNQRPTVSRRLPLEKEQAAHLMALREGDRVGGVVVNLVGYGAFVTLNCGLTGLLHLSEFSWTEKYSDPAELLQIGQQVNVLILSVDFERRHIALSLRQLQPDPWMDIEGRVRVGCVVEGTVQSLTKKLAFIEIEPGVRGVVHVSHLSWTYRPKNSDEMLRVGQSVRCLVLSLDAESRKMELGLRELEVDPWLEKIPREYTVGDIRLGKVCNVVKYGVFVELERDLHGLLHRSEIPGESDGTEKIERHFESGEQLRVRIVAIDQGTRKIGLSLMLDP
jgi:small subunit ribosomal protein S1